MAAAGATLSATWAGPWVPHGTPHAGGADPHRRRMAGPTAAAALLHLCIGGLVLLGLRPTAMPPSLPEGAEMALVFVDAPGTAGSARAGEPDPLEVAPAPAAMQAPASAVLPPLPVVAHPELPPIPSLALPDPPLVPSLALPDPPLVPSLALPDPPLVPSLALPDPPPAPSLALSEPLPPPPLPVPSQQTAAVATQRMAARPTASRPAPRGRPGGDSDPAMAQPNGASAGLTAAPAPSPSEPPLITAPRFRRPPRPPDYPRRAVELEITGTVVVRALLDAEGDPRETRVQRSSGHPLLDGAALAAVRGWAFQPAARDGQRVPAWVEVPVHFRLH